MITVDDVWRVLNVVHENCRHHCAPHQLLLKLQICCCVSEEWRRASPMQSVPRDELGPAVCTWWSFVVQSAVVLVSVSSEFPAVVGTAATDNTSAGWLIGPTRAEVDWLLGLFMSRSVGSGENCCIDCTPASSYTTFVRMLCTSCAMLDMADLNPIRFSLASSFSNITGCAVAQHCYNGDVSFLWEKWKLDPL